LILRQKKWRGKKQIWHIQKHNDNAKYKRHANVLVALSGKEETAFHINVQVPRLKLIFFCNILNKREQI